MTFRIHYTIHEYDDSFDVSGANVDEVRIAAFDEMKRRRLHQDTHLVWSEELTEQGAINDTQR